MAKRAHTAAVIAVGAAERLGHTDAELRSIALSVPYQVIGRPERLAEGLQEVADAAIAQVHGLPARGSEAMLKAITDVLTLVQPVD